MIWRQPNKVGFAFGNMTASDAPASDLDERLRKSEQKKQLLQRRIKEIWTKAECKRRLTKACTHKIHEQPLADIRFGAQHSSSS